MPREGKDRKETTEIIERLREKIAVLEKQEQKLLQNQQWFEIIMKYASDGINISEYDPKTNRRTFVLCNEKYLELSGKTREQLAAANDMLDFIRHDYSEEEIRTFRKKIIEGKPYNGLAFWTKEDGTKVYNEWAAAPVNIGGKLYVIGIDRDVTEQKLAEEQLKLQALRNKTMLETSADGFCVVSLDGEILEANPALSKLTGYSHDELIGMSLAKLEVIESAEGIKQHIKDITSTGFERFETQHRRKDGQILDIEVYTQYCHFGDKHFLFSFFHDISARKRSQKELEKHRSNMARAELLASLGTLSATCAHELNQPLTVINLAIENSLAQLEKTKCPDTVFENLNDAINELNVAVDIVARFRSFAQKTVCLPDSVVNISMIAQKVIELFNESASESSVSIETDSLDKLPLMRCDFNDIEQLFFAMIQNSIHAAKNNSKSKLTISGKTNGSNIEIVFEDTCGGIKPENIDRLFEPFFTTKNSQLATGLGLCIVDQIVSRYGGNIKVKNSYPIGTAFHITLPTKPN